MSRALLTLLGTMTALLAVEGLLRLRADVPSQLAIFRLDEHGLLGMVPGARARHVTREWDVSIRINQRGLRDREQPVPDPGGRVLLVGDSMAFGWGVELEETFGFRAEELLADSGIRIVKAGMVGTGTLDQRRWLEAHLEELEPDQVVVAFYVGNDFVDVARGGVEGQLFIDDGLLVRSPPDGKQPTTLAGLIAGLVRRSMLAQKIQQVHWSRMPLPESPGDREHRGLTAADRWLWEFARTYLAEPPADVAEMVSRTLAELDGIADLCAERGVQLRVLVIPRSIEVYEWEQFRWIKAFDLAEDELDVERPHRELAAWAAPRQVPLLDLLPGFQEHPREERLFFYPDSHLNPRGHAVIAEALAWWLGGGDS